MYDSQETQRKELIAELENYKVRSALIRAVEVGTIRSKELNIQ